LCRRTDLHLDKHPRPEIRDAEGQDQKKRGKDGGFDRRSGVGGFQKVSEHRHH